MKTKDWLCLLLVVALCSELAVSRRGGGRGGGGLFGSRRSSSSSRRSTSWFGSRKSAPKQNSYPKQQWGTSNTGGRTNNNYPKQQYANTNTNSKPAIGGGGFVNPKTNGNSGFGTKYGYGSNYNSRYGGGSSIPTYSYRSPGYGTRFGTSFPGGMGRYGGAGYSKKSLGLGVGAGFLGGAAVGIATMSVYHRYMMYNQMMNMHRYGHYNDPYYNNYYSRGQCMGGCPMHSRCEYGFCECYAGYLKGNGQCYPEGRSRPERGANFDPFQPCLDASSCQRMDINLICNTNLTTTSEGRCECRRDMKWNEEASECQFYMNVDCTSITYDTKPSPLILEAVNKTLDDIGDEKVEEEPIDANSTVTPEETLKNSLLSNIDPKAATENEITEAFCRDVDSFSWEFGGQQQQQQQNNRVNYGRNTGSTIGIGVLIAMLVFACCVCALVVKCFKKVKSFFSGPSHSEQHNTGKDITGLNEINPPAPGIVPNPGYQPQPTPIHNLPYSATPAYPSLPPSDTSFQNPYGDPAPIPPTQPGYTNFAPVDVNAQPAAVYPPQQYPPPAYQQNTPYPPISGAAPYPPASNAAPYPPTYPPAPNAAPYPPYNQGYPPYPADNTNPPPYNPSAP